MEEGTFLVINQKVLLNRKSLVLNQLVKQIVIELKDFVDFRNINISITENISLSVKMDAQLANILVVNLIRNAVF